MLVAVVSDLHCNSINGLCPAAVTLDGGGTYRASKPQRVVWAAWKEYWDIIEQKKKSLDASLYVVVNGEAGDLNTHDGAGLISRNRADAEHIAALALDKPRQMADKFFMVRGTAAHEGPHSSLAETVAKDLDATPDEDEGTASWWWLPLIAGGVLFDIAHHPQTSARRPWTKAAAAARHSAIVRYESMDDGRPVPDIALRGHIHYYQPGPRTPKPLFIYCPPWQLMTAFGHRLGAGGHVEKVGGLWFLCQDGSYTWGAERWGPRRKRPWSDK